MCRPPRKLIYFRPKQTFNKVNRINSLRFMVKAVYKNLAVVIIDREYSHECILLMPAIISRSGRARQIWWK